MQDTHVSEWGIIEASVKGANHVHLNLPNQDAKQTLQQPDCSLIAVADGHGSKAYFRSERGAQLAVESAITEMEYLLNQLPPLTDLSQAMVDHLLKSSPIAIVERWHKHVEEDIRANPLPEGNDQHSYPFKPYGTTLLSVLATPSLIFYSQIGDGDILVVTEDGHVREPIPGDTRLFANETTSLSTKHAERDFRMALDEVGREQGGKSTPALIILATDGYRNSFNSEADFFKVATDILNLLRRQGPDYVQQHLESWLQTATDQGSGDDIAAIFLWNKRLLQPNRQATLAQDYWQASTGEKPVTPGSGAENTQRQSQEENDNTDASTMPDKLLLSNASFHHTSKKAGGGVETLFTSNVEPHRADKRTTLFVSQEPGTGYYASITEALKSASDGSTIIIHPGEYREQLSIERDVYIEAKEPGQVVIKSPVPCISCHAPNVHITGLRIHGQNQQDIRDQPAVSLGDGYSEFIKCDISSESQLIVGISAQNTSSLFSECTIHDSNALGFLLEESARCEVKQCKFQNNRETHIVLDAASELACDDSIFSTSGKHGIYIGKDCCLILTHCTIEKYADSGVCLRQNKDALLEDSILQEGLRIGLSIIKGHCMVRGGAIKNQQEYAIYVQQESTLRLNNVNVQHHHSDIPAMTALQQSTIHIEACDPVDVSDNWYFSDPSSQIDVQVNATPSHNID
ncbi:protein phosphatase 2C domain-containing protein [Dictyobacter formicarum]|uniref:PPM-type phosphatase domain-containing protein n=1 Tax=Dictyobacter formicarum TaxID=2778368 RepID=A0ABQ3V8W9_9CHLR|nr:protein phosphatase 2C domain-containing protein [Dictyobacter formicarum]GHO82273.1 hypothetical protein KSZ_02790 [Dictyobacter formicarum]